MKAKIVLILVILLIVLVATVYAADVKWSALAENTTVADDDVLCVIDTGTGGSQKITVLNFFDTIDTFAELNTITADKTLVNEEDVVTWDAVITFATNIAFSDAATIDQSANNYIDFTENSDIFQLYFDATDIYQIWSDGALNLQNAEDTDAIVNILGKDAGEKGILRVLSDGDDNYIELHHDDTDGHIITDTGDIHIEANGGDINFADDNITTTGIIDLNPGHTGSVNVIDITPSAAISTNEASWNSIYIGGTALDPSGDDILLCGVNVDMSGVVFGGTGGDIDGIGINMAGGEDHAIHISQGKFVAENTVAATAGAEFTIFDIQVHTAAMHANSTIHAIDIATPETPAGTVVAVGTHSNVEVIQQSIGTFSTPNQTEYAGEKHTGGTVWADGVDGSEIFVVDDDEIYVGSVAQFGEIDVIMNTPGTKTVTPTFHYNTAADTWTEFFPADDTDGFQQSGIIRWTLADISGSWTNNGDPGGADSSAGYWIKIIRTANADPGTPTPTTVKTGAITSYFWNKTGAVDVLSMDADTITEGGVAVYNDDEIDAFAEIDAIVADKSLVNLEDGGTFTGNIIANANLSVGNTTTTAGVLTLLEDDDDGANFASFMVPTLVANTVYTLPPDDGDNTEVLQTNGAGVLTWVANAGGGATAWDDIGNPDNAGLTTITFDNAELTLLTGDNDAAASFVTIQNTDADHTVGNLYLLDLDYSADDGDADADFIKCQDSGGTVFSVGQDGETAMNGGITAGGSLEAATITEGLVAVPNVDELDWVAAAEMADADHGDVQWAAGVAYVQAATIADSTYASCYVGLFQAATGNNEPFYTDGGLTYDATSGTLSSTVLTEGGNAVYNSTEVPAGSLGGTWANPTIDDLFILLGGDVATAGDYDFGSANVDLELPQTSPAVPDVDGQIELDFTDGTIVIQHGSAHAELGASTDVVVGKLIGSFGGTIYEPDGMVDIITVKAINSIEFPHGIVVTAIYLGVASNDNYTLEFQNWDDFDTVNAGDPLIDSVAYTADASGEVIDTAPTFATIAAGQIIKISIPATDVDWINFCIYYYEPAG